MGRAVNGGGKVEVEIEEVGAEEGNLSDRASVKRGVGFDFLEGIPDDEKVKELEDKKGECKKRKRGSELAGRRVEIGETTGWRIREEESRNSEKWKREVGTWKLNESGLSEKRKEELKIPLPENYRLGLDGRIGFLNHSGKFKNNFGLNKGALFPGGEDGKREGKNWLASFTKSGCVACRNDKGGNNHKGREGAPVVLLVGDEAVPSVIGHTGEESKAAECAWVLKMEHPALEEVAVILDKVNREKRDADKKRGKRVHEFFVPNGSKILVSATYTLEGKDWRGM